MANYSGQLLQNTVSSSFKSAGVLQAAGRRIMLYELEFGQGGGLASSDCQCQWDLSRIASTNTLAGSAFTVQLLDPADATASSLFFNAITTEPPNVTTAGNGLFLKQWSINQRGSYRWRALDDNDNVIVASAASQGLAMRTLSTSFTGSAIGSLAFVER